MRTIKDDLDREVAYLSLTQIRLSGTPVYEESTAKPAQFNS